MPQHLFFYGVLREGVGDWPFLQGLGLGLPATTTGALYAIPAGDQWYPALILTQARFSTIVHGTIHEAGSVDLAAIDAFEGADYTRQPIEVDGWDGYGDTLAQAYVWTAGLPENAVPIPHGDFVRWLEETGNTPLSQESER
ncbi:MAG: gamma-glutamylcyclotransferase family protein [Erythrobacter sp.]|uniref:gamma-glutamylcyclotransferase family protein n=1 Tax=Erythrobacter sp. TaxID=1042 RepID=UPI00261E510D|nr:gamma-glutamylcyclotransferase family protein [Erythrobacter sp.]MDJ0979531.1 gamma-glutamylcyclotransferase family protein [Erythrobacter sp.]